VSLRIDRLSVDIARRRIVSDISLNAGDRQFTALLGPNGSGKSTILKTLYRVHKPAAGRVLLDGADLLALPARDAARRVAVVAQETVSEFDFTVREMVMIGRTPHKRAFDGDTEADHAAAEQAIERSGCAHLAQRSFNTLSGGEKQLVLIARALAQGADHLILDEPTNHLDIRHQVQILELIAGLGVTILAALHDLSLAALFCQQAYLLSEGRVILGGAPASVLTQQAILCAYGADVLVIDHPDTGTPHLIPRRTRPDSQAPRQRPEIPDRRPDIPDIPDTSIPASPKEP
jgi:iron complex transport system ATP-binding protein